MRAGLLLRRPIAGRVDEALQEPPDGGHGEQQDAEGDCEMQGDAAGVRGGAHVLLVEEVRPVQPGAAQEAPGALHDGRVGAGLQRRGQQAEDGVAADAEEPGPERGGGVRGGAGDGGEREGDRGGDDFGEGVVVHEG